MDNKQLWQEALKAVGVAYALKGTEAYDKVKIAFKALAAKKELDLQQQEQSDQKLSLWNQAVQKATNGTLTYVSKNTAEYEKAMKVYREMKREEDQTDPVKAAWRKACLEKGRREVVRKVDADYEEVKSYFRTLLPTQAL
jgi:hypothetical protein